MRIFFLALLLIIQPAYANIHFLSISDIHYGENIVTKDGTDTNKTLLTKALDQFSQLVKKVDFVLFLGDLPAHSVLYSTKSTAYLKTVFHALYQANKSDKPMFYITGNNDSPRGNYLPFSWKGESPLTFANDWQGACAHCEGLIIDGTHMQDKGYYSSYVIPGNQDIILIALNTVQFANTPFYRSEYPNQDRDALPQLHWLDEQLKTHPAKQVLIAMHIPPGKNYKGRALWREAYTKQFINILNHTLPKYEQITLLTSHTHMDDIRKIKLKDGTAIYAYATPSVSPSNHNNPSMKVFELNARLQLQDYVTYYTTSYTEWTNDHYQAKKDIFPQCQTKEPMENCLNHYNNIHLCNALNKGQFYGSKSPRVDGSVCGVTYPVN